MKIVLSSNTSWNLWNFRYSLMKALRNKNYNVIAVAPKDKFSELLKREFEFIELTNLNRRGKNPLKDLKLFFEFFNIYKEIKPDLVINFTIKPVIYSSYACSLLKIRTISVITGLGYVYTRENILPRITNILYKLSLTYNTNIIFQNLEDMKMFLEKEIVSKEKALLIKGSGIDTVKFSPTFCESLSQISEKGNVTFLMISRILWDKGVKEFVESAKFIKKKYPYVKFQLLGPIDSGNPSGISKETIRNWQKMGIIEYLGETEDVRPFICQADCIVLPSYREGLPRVLLEAMAMEKPIITTDVPGCRDTVIDGINGFLVKPRDIKDLRTAFEKFLNLPAKERKRMGKKGREMVLKEFDEKIVIEKYLEVIEKALRK